MNFKRTLFSAILLVLITTSCIFSTDSKSDLQKSDVLGTWQITKQSKKDFITHFVLNHDSTATVSFGGANIKTRAGNWVWEAKKEIGNKHIEIEIKSDVVISVTGYTLGLQLNETKGKISLVGGGYSFEKL